MTTRITPADLRETVYKPVGGYFEADGKTLASFGDSGIRTRNIPRSSSGQYHVASDENRHFLQGFNPLSFSLEAVPDPKENTKTLKFLPPGVADNIIYLPYFQKNITSTVIHIDDESVCYFITDAMSGCNFFIDKLPNGDLVCYHANALQDSSTEAAVTTMDMQHRTALSAYPGAVNVASLRKADYYAQEQASVNRKAEEDDKSKVQFSGGATIMGFRVDGEWEFWFQTYGRFTYRSSGFTGFMKGIKGKGKDVKIGEVEQEIIDVQRFWQEQRG